MSGVGVGLCVPAPLGPRAPGLPSEGTLEPGIEGPWGCLSTAGEAAWMDERVLAGGGDRETQRLYADTPLSAGPLPAGGPIHGRLDAQPQAQFTHF